MGVLGREILYPLKIPTHLMHSSRRFVKQPYSILTMITVSKRQLPYGTLTKLHEIHIGCEMLSHRVFLLFHGPALVWPSFLHIAILLPRTSS